jgi:hypothetical protein
VAGVSECTQKQVEGGRGEGELLVDLNEVRKERRGRRPSGEEGSKESAGVGRAAGAGQDVEQLGVREQGRTGRGKSEEVQRGVGVETDPAQGCMEERRGEGAGGGGEEAGGGGEAMQEEEAGEAAQEGGICAGVGRNGRRGGVDAAAEKVERSEAGAASLVHTA